VRDASGNARRFHESKSPWLRSFSLESLKVLVVCRGPVRMEAFQVFDELGIDSYGMLLSEKDSITYPRCLAPELRDFRFPENVHRVPDYMGAGQEEKLERIDEIVEIAKCHGYTHIFAGYGFMAEDAEFVEAIEKAGVGFLGPSSGVIRRAGAKDEAKKLARSLGNAVIPGVDNVSALALAKRAPDRGALEGLAKEHALDFAWNDAVSLEENAEALLQAGYAATLELVTVEELQAQATAECATIWKQYADNRIRFKHIGGGGGKGQRVVAKPEEISAAVMDVLAESKAVAPGSNRNFLIELNIERTRHNEIQLVGNGKWSISLGGRDCSVQMHEQKLVEVSLTKELLDTEIAAATGATAKKLRGDQSTLQRMEDEAEKFGEATGLDSVSTFECIVEGFNHFFMEMNTRIQVEHIVTELVYGMKFTNPKDSKESFVVESLIEAMALLALHGERLERPERVLRHTSGVEIRINATNQALQPHAGGLIRGWTPALTGEIRYDQGIGLRNPDTGSFVYYNLAGAYDSNVALILTDGENRRDNYERLSEILRRTEMRGDDLETNTQVHYGLINWFLGKGAMAEPDTRFMSSYLGAVGALQRAALDFDMQVAVGALMSAQEKGEARQVLAEKETLLVRPMEMLLGYPHSLGGFLGRYDGKLWNVTNGKVEFVANPVEFLSAIHHYLDMEVESRRPPSWRIWDHDEVMLDAANSFYARVAAATGARSQSELEALFGGSRDDRLADGDEALWDACVSAHRGHQLGLELLLVIPRIAHKVGFLDIHVDDELQVHFPEAFADLDNAALLARALAPPPPASSDEIVTPMGGTFFAREAPHMPLLVDEGDHFEAGQPLFIIEVMKMFNKILAPFAGTVVKNLMAGKDAVVVKKGEQIFQIEPDERIEVESESDRKARMREATLALM
jgi:acetyl/propionyl-CoA carboxylase alpha subunit